jgi:hypothetical protein
MSRTQISILASVLMLFLAAPRVEAANVALSLNVFPTALANPNGGGAWTLVAKTDTVFGIAAISIRLGNIDATGIVMESDIGATLNNGSVIVFPVPGGHNILYGQDPAGPIVFGVGTPAMSDGLDPLNDSVWNDATRIVSGTYGGTVPVFIPSNSANVFTQSGTPPLPQGAVSTSQVTTLVRVAVPEPALAALLVGAVPMCLQRRRIAAARAVVA